MALVVLTKNNFLRLALHSVYDELNLREDTCVIDTESFNALIDILYEIYSRDLVSCRRILLVGDDIGSKILFPLNVISLDSPLTVLKNQMHTGYRLKAVLERIYECRRLVALTDSERLFAQYYSSRNSIKNIARRIGLSEKTVYQQTASAAAKLNLRSGKEFLLFLDREFSNNLGR
ncbi:hypothetical protein M5Y66_14680 [Enterobacter vonholyi]|uniref:helix-turn-helix transcriptional regulator n=1 Tax=Enterobacter vonholyi TaxID=2797505 RepID=UPI0020C04AC5|nr:hypothetical protein [Enterobacter vonholyi]MCL5635728.1 hypothetical protein [Enterobacter vonholyi]